MGHTRAGRPAFDHREPGTPAAAWHALREALPAGAGVDAHDHLVVLAAHPDDETLGAGGLIADAAAAGAQVTVVVATDGEASHPDSPTHTAEQLAALRQDEVREAVTVLAPAARVVLLHRPDGRLADDPDGLRDDVDGVAQDATVLAAPWREDGHPDHDTCGAVAAAAADARAVRLLEYPVWGWHWGRPGESGPLDGDGWVARRMSPSAREAKTAALARHRSQHEPLSDAPGDGSVLPAGVLAHFDGVDEVFRVAPARDLPQRYFERLWTGDEDVWGLERSFYERRKRTLLLAVLPRTRFRSVYEPGCATGVTTVELARRADEVVASDISAAALARARERTAGCANVELLEAAVPEDWPPGRFDLVVVSELGYYLADPGRLAERVRTSLTEDGVLVACHWRHPTPGYPSTADAVHAALGAGLHRLVEHVEEDFLLDVWSVDGTSVARAEGVV